MPRALGGVVPRDAIGMCGVKAVVRRLEGGCRTGRAEEKGNE
jgi:hypothetical protein